MSQEANKDKVGYIGKTIYELMDECALNESDEFELKQYEVNIQNNLVSKISSGIIKYLYSVK